MSLNTLNELKRRLDDDSTPLPKRLCLAKNVILSHHFPTGPKETLTGCWLEDIAQKNKLDSKELDNIMKWVGLKELTSDFKSKLIQILSIYLQKNQIKDENIEPILSFLENEKISSQITQEIDEYLVIVITILQYLRHQDTVNYCLCERILNNIVKYYRDCKKKLKFIIKLLDGENLETIFSFLHTECHNVVLHVCQNILFPENKKSFFVSFLQTLIRKENIDELMAEKGDNIQSVLKIMSTFFTFPKGRTEKNPEFISNFIEVFVSCFKNESQLIYAFYIMVVNSLNMDQSYLNPTMKMPPIIFEDNDEKVKRNLFLKMLDTILKNEVDISVRLTDSFGEKISKVEIKKTFMSFLQAVMMGQLKLEGKIDRATYQIINKALELDPMLIEQRMTHIIPPIMTAKKNSTTSATYIDMMNCLLEILFKLSRGTLFINQILPQVKLCLEASNTEQFELKQRIKECEDNGMECEKLKSKLVTGNDLFPPEYVEMYGKLASELMFRQNKELLLSLQKDFEEHCLMMLEEGFVSPSIITLAESLSAILSSFLRYSKMADHTVPKQISEDFWLHFQNFETECLGKFGECILKLNYNPQLSLSFLKLSLSVAHLKLLNVKYSHTKLDNISVSDSLEVFDLSALLPCLSSEQWITLASKVTDDEAVLVLDNLLLVKTIADQLLTKQIDENDEQCKITSSTKTHIIKQLNSNPEILNVNGFANALFINLDQTQSKLVAKNLVKIFLSNSETNIMKSFAVINNRILLNAIVLESAKAMAKCFENLEDLSKSLGKSDFDMSSFIKEINVDVKEYFEQVSLRDDQESIISNCIDIYRQLPLPYLEESYQLVAIFMLLCSKKCCSKKVRKSADYVLLNIFELSPKYPDIYKIFSPKVIFSFDDKTIFNLLILKLKISNNMFVIKSILESAVKKVKTNSEIITEIVEILLTQQKIKKEDTSSIEYFSDPVFQIICIVLPIITKDRKAITQGKYRSILANLQEKLYKSLLKCFKNINFGSNCSLLNETNGNIDESMVVSENTMAALNAIGTYSLTLAKYCGTTNAEEIKNLDCLWSSLEFFIQNAIASIQNPCTKAPHVDSSIQLLNVTLRDIKKLDSHPIFENKDELFIKIWKSIVERLKIVYGQNKRVVLDELSTTLKYLCELSSVECFVTKFLGDLTSLGVLNNKKSPFNLLDDSTTITSHKVSSHLWNQILKANLLGPKCHALAKLLFNICKEMRTFIQTLCDVDVKKRPLEDDVVVRTVKVNDEICEILKIDLDVIAEAVLAAKKITLDYKLLDAIFSVQHLIHSMIGSFVRVRCDVTWESFFKLFDGCIAVLNNLIVSREELLEDRWPNYMQCYRALVTCVCERSTSQASLERAVDERLADLAHNLEKLTQSMCKRKQHVSRIAAYTVADICSLLERTGPSRMVRQHMENCAALMLQAADSSYAAAFLRRALASSPGHATLANMYTFYKRYHKYVGNA